jgi:dTDP-4-amino-4,6-dideoxygalactose transaminase
VTFPPEPDWDGEILQWTDVLCANREAIETAFKADQIDSRAFWLPLHRQQPYKLPDTDFANAIEISRRGLWLPSSFDLSEEQAERVARAIWRAADQRQERRA